MKSNSSLGEAYYKAIKAKNLSEIQGYLHPDVEFIAPLATVKGKEGVLKAVEGFMNFIHDLTIHGKFDNQNQAVIIYEVDCPQPVGHIRATSLMNIQDHLISRIELFYDARPFEKK